MAKAPGGLSFTPKPTQPLCVVPHFGWENLYGYAVPEQDVTSAINCSHTALPEHCVNLVLAVEHRTHEGRRIVFQHLAINRAKAHAIVEFPFTNSAVFHLGLSPNDAKIRAKVEAIFASQSHSARLGTDSLAHRAS